MLHPSYFEMVSSLWFETYFRVSKHLGCPISEVIRNKFSADYQTRLQFWKKFNFQAKFAIYFKVEDILGLNEDITNRLFRDD